jgi:hypothetical protein
MTDLCGSVLGLAIQINNSSHGQGFQEVGCTLLRLHRQSPTDLRIAKTFAFRSSLNISPNCHRGGGGGDRHQTQSSKTGRRGHILGSHIHNQGQDMRIHSQGHSPHNRRSSRHKSGVARASYPFVFPGRTKLALSEPVPPLARVGLHCLTRGRLQADWPSWRLPLT